VMFVSSFLRMITQAQATQIELSHHSAGSPSFSSSTWFSNLSTEIAILEKQKNKADVALKDAARAASLTVQRR
jgi:hypothetical protein